MSIDLEHLNSADITDTNLGDFLAAIDAALTASEYTKVKKAIEQIYAIALIPGTTIDVDKNGNNSIDINPGETANLTKIAKEIYEKVQNDINDTSKTNSADRDALIDEMNKYLTGIFNQQSLTAEIISRGFSIEDFSKAIDNANKTSESRIKDLQRERDAKKRKAETILGKDELISTGNFTKKSIPTQLEDLKNAEDYFVFVENLLKKLEKAIADRNAATDKTVYDKFISDVEGRLKYTVNRIKELKIENLDNSDLDKLADTSEVTNSLAAGGTLENLRSEIEVKKTTV